MRGGGLILDEGRTSTVQVLGFENASAASEWDDPRIGLGLSALLADALYGSGRFRLVETDTALHARREQIMQGVWAGLYRDDALATFATEFDADYVAWGRLLSFGVPRSGFSVGVVHHHATSSLLRVELVLQQRTNGQVWRATGEGRAATRSASVLLTPNNDQAPFDESTLGPALRAAVDEALRRMLR